MSLRSPPRDKRWSCVSETEGAVSTAFLPSGRTVYINRNTRCTSWIPPRSEWNCRLCLPYGWEEAIDAFGNLYFINHVDRVCTYDDPRQCCCSDHANGSCGSLCSTTRIEAPPQRSYKIARHPEIGFGFVAASQRPVLIQFVTPGGPSDGKLLTNDQILSVNGIDARCLQKEEVVNLVRETLNELHITVTQPTGKQRNLRRRHCRVRFCDQIVISDNDEVESMPILPNVLRVFLENGQTKSFKYDEHTSVQDVVNSLVEKLNLRCPNRFALALEQSIGSRSARLTLLLPHRKLAELVEASSMPYAKCRFRLAFMPANMQEFFTDDPNAFRYLYDQCVNDVVAGRFATEMRYEACVRLAALHMRQVAVDTGALVADGYTSLTRAEREYGLATFVPMILLENVKAKELRKHLRFYLKKDDAQLVLMSGTKSGSVRSCTSLRKESVNDEALEASISGIGDPADEIRLRYVQIVSHLPTFGGRCFCVTFKKTHVDMVVQADMRNGLLVRHPGRINDQNISIDYKLVDELRIIHETDILRSVTVKLRNTAQQGLEFLLDKEDIDDFIMYISGYCKVLLEKDVEVTFDRSECNNELLQAPAYSAHHFVHCAGWNFALKVPIECAVAVDYSEPLSYEDALSISGNNSYSIVPSLRESGKSNGTVVSEKAARNSIVQANGATSTNVIVSARHRSPRKSWIPELFTAGGFPGRRHGSPRPRDSIRIHKQRHSIPTGTLLTVLEAPERRFSTATGATHSARLTPSDVARRRLTLAPNMDLWNPVAEDVVLLSSQATPRAGDKSSSVKEKASGACPHNGGKHADDDDLVKSTEDKQASHNRPDNSRVPKTYSVGESEEPTTQSFGLPAIRIHRPLRHTFSLDEGQKRVRFDFSTISGGSSLEEHSGESEIEQEGPSSLLPTSLSVGQRAFSAAKATASAFSPRSLFTKRGRRRRASVPTPERLCIRKRIPNSITFPMSTKQKADEGFDFGEPPAKGTKAKEQREAEAKACIRRLSLKEFSGLDPQPRPAQHQYATSYASPLMTRLPRASIAAETYGHLLDNYSNHRRRSTASLNRVGLGTLGNVVGSRENIYDYFDKAISECSASACASPARVPTTESVHPIPASIDFALLYERICHIRNRLRATLDSMPSASPKRQHNVEAEKADLLRELSRLANACKNMVRAVSSYPPPTKADLFVQSYEAVESADHVTGVAENLIVKSKSLFQAQLMNAKTEQMLKALFETISDVERTHGLVRPTGEARKAIKSSTTLAATLTQLIHSVRGV